MWVREKTEETDAPEVVEARREALRAKAVIGDGEGVELDAEKAKQEALGGVSEETMDKTAREIQCFRLAAFDVNIDELEVKEWLRPDADPSDYFNYGMGEDTWRQYRDQQLILRRSLQERRAAMAQAAARERHAELLKQGPPQPPTLPMPIMGGPRPPWGGGPMPPPNAFPPRGFPGQARLSVDVQIYRASTPSMQRVPTFHTHRAFLREGSRRIFLLKICRGRRARPRFRRGPDFLRKGSRARLMGNRRRRRRRRSRAGSGRGRASGLGGGDGVGTEVII